MVTTRSMAAADSAEVDGESLELASVDSRATVSTYTTARSNQVAAAPVVEPAADGGRQAWTFLAAAFVVEALIWGMPNSYGVLVDAYQQSDQFRNDSSLLSLVGQFSAGLMYLLSPAVIVLLHLYPNWRRRAILIGAIVCPASLLASSFVESTGLLMVFQGVTYPMGGAAIYYATQLFLQDWFVRKRGLANGICFAATGLGGACFPPLYSVLISKYGIRSTLLSMSITYFVAFAAIIPFLRPRSSRLPTRGFGFGPETRSSLKQRATILFVIVNTFQALGFFLPALWLPTFATSMGLSPAQSSSTVSALNGAAVASRLLLGLLSDRQSPHLLACTTSLAASLSVYLGWAVGGTSFGALLAFSLLYGALAGGWTSLWSGILREVGKTDPESNATLFGMLSLTRGIGVMLSAPIASALQKSDYAGRSLGLGVSEGVFAGIILFCGSTLAVAGLLETTQAIAQARGKRSN